jgi:uncharacterized membrane protein YgaE (UPF0421/DUF939 family)
MLKDLQFLTITVELLVAAVIAFLFIRSKAPKQTIEQQNQLINILKDRVEALEDETKACTENHIENITRIKELEGRVDELRNIPLKEISKAQKDILTTQKEILQIIKEIKA